MKYILFLLFIASCSETDKTNEKPIEDPIVDSILLTSRKLHDSSDVVLKVAEKTAEQAVKGIVSQVDEMNYKIDGLQKDNQILSDENNALKESIKVTKSTIIRDTIFITEKKNFWGRTKRMTDSSQSVREDITVDTSNDYKPNL